jgi:hypothetical protein
VSSKLLEERQAEMRERLARDRKSAKRQAIQVEDKSAVAEIHNAPPKEPTIVKQPNGTILSGRLTANGFILYGATSQRRRWTCGEFPHLEDSRNV